MTGNKKSHDKVTPNFVRFTYDISSFADIFLKKHPVFDYPCLKHG